MTGSPWLKMAANHASIGRTGYFHGGNRTAISRVAPRILRPGGALAGQKQKTGAGTHRGNNSRVPGSIGVPGSTRVPGTAAWRGAFAQPRSLPVSDQVATVRRPGCRFFYLFRKRRDSCSIMIVVTCAVGKGVITFHNGPV